MPWLEVLISIVIMIGLLVVILALLGKVEIRSSRRDRSSRNGNEAKSDAYHRGADGSDEARD